MLDRALIDVLFKQSPMRMAVVSVPDYRYEMVSDAEAEFYEGLGVTNYIGREWTEVWTDSSPPQFFEYLEKVRKTGKPFSIVDEPLRLCVNGRERSMCVSFRYVPICGPGGAVEHILWAGAETTGRRDVTESLRLQQALETARLEAEQRAAEWTALIRSSPEAIYVTDDQGTVLEANPAWHQYTGFGPDVPLPNTLDIPGLILTHPDGSPIAAEDMPTRRTLSGEKVAGFRYRMTNVKGQTFEFMHNATAIDTPRGKRSLSIVTDITEIRRLERLKDEFMLVIGHELRNPLQVILGLIQLLSLKIPADLRRTVGSTIESLENQTRFLASMVDDLLNAYRIGSGRLSIDTCRIDFRDALLQAMDTQVVDTDHSWSISIWDSAVPVRADPQRLIQIITNILTNARKYTPPERRIWVNLTVENGVALLSVEDEGIGIPPEDLERVFEGFYRSPDVAKWRTTGLGLGLYIGRGLTRRMGGDLWAENRPAGGTVMRLKMPLAQDPKEVGS